MNWINEEHDATARMERAKRYQDKIAAYLRNDESHTTPFTKLFIKEFLEYQPPSFKADRIYRTAMKAGKLNLARRIKAKYKLQPPDDVVTAMGWTLIATRVQQYTIAYLGMTSYMLPLDNVVQMGHREYLIPDETERWSFANYWALL